MRLLKLRSILVASDLDDASRSAIRTAVRLVQLAEAQIHLVHVAENHVDTEGLLAHFKSATPEISTPDSVRVLEGPPAEMIAQHARTVAADAIVMGPHRGEGDFGVLGSTAARVVRDAPCACLVAANEIRLPIEHVLVPLDLSDVAEQALAIALTWASALRPRKDRTHLMVLHVMPHENPDSERAISALVDHARDDAAAFARVDIHQHVAIADDPAREILTWARNESTDLLVVGTRGASGEGLEPGGMAAAIAQGATCPLLLVPPAAGEEMPYWSSDQEALLRERASRG